MVLQPEQTILTTWAQFNPNRLSKYVEEDMTRDKKINRTPRTYYIE